MSHSVSTTTFSRKNLKVWLARAVPGTGQRRILTQALGRKKWPERLILDKTAKNESDKD